MGNHQKIIAAVFAVIVAGAIIIIVIKPFKNAAYKTHIEAVKDDLFAMAAAAQGYYMRPDIMNGGGTEFTDIKWSTMGDVDCVIDSYNPNLCINENGRYTIITVNQDSIKIAADPLQIDEPETLEIIIYADTVKFAGNSCASDR